VFKDDFSAYARQWKEIFFAYVRQWKRTSLSVVLSHLREAVGRRKMFCPKFCLIDEYSARCEIQ